MHDDQIRGLLRTLEDDRTPDPAFSDALYRRLHMVAEARPPSRAPFVLMAAALVTIVAAALAVGSGVLRLPDTVDASASPMPTTSPLAVASPSASGASDAPSPSAQPSMAPDATDAPDTVMFAEADGLRIRSRPSESGEIVATIRRGQLMGGTGERADVDGVSWYQVRIGPGDLQGWVSTGPEGTWLRLVQDGLVTFTCGLCGDAPAVVSVMPFGDSSITTMGPAQELSEYRWSPDGSRMVASRGGTTLPYRIVVFDAQGNELDELGIGAAPTWSPDGSRLAWLGADGITVTDENLEPTSIDIGGLSSGAPFWSPDGTRFAVIANENPGAIDPPVSLFIVPVTGGEAQRLTAPSTINGVTWAPDSSMLGFSVVDLSGEAPSQAYVIPAAGGDPEPVFGGGAVLTPPIWSPDGTRLAAITPDGVVTAAGDAEAVVLVPAEPGETIGELRWSPSGRWLLYSVSTGREPALFIVRSDGSEAPRAISPEGAGGQQAEWQPVLAPLNP
jgi:Tol biopolymer transport system component